MDMGGFGPRGPQTERIKHACFGTNEGAISELGNLP